MSMFNHQVVKAEDRKTQLAREAEMERLANAVQSGQPGWWSQLLFKTGSVLVSTGMRLKTRYEATKDTIHPPLMEPRVRWE